jgi:uncharacterized membrane protein
LTGSLEFANSFTLRSSNKRNSIGSTMTQTATSPTASVDYLESAYKMIDLGTAVAIHEENIDSQQATLKTVTEMAFAG